MPTLDLMTLRQKTTDAREKIAQAKREKYLSLFGGAVGYERFLSAVTERVVAAADEGKDCFDIDWRIIRSHTNVSYAHDKAEGFWDYLYEDVGRLCQGMTLILGGNGAAVYPAYLRLYWGGTDADATPEDALDNDRA